MTTVQATCVSAYFGVGESPFVGVQPILFCLVLGEALAGRIKPDAWPATQAQVAQILVMLGLPPGEEVAQLAEAIFRQRPSLDPEPVFELEFDDYQFGDRPSS